MKDLDVKYLKNESMEISISPKSFDSANLDVEYPELYKKYTTIEIITTEKVVVNKKDLERFYPEEYEDCLIELTPRLSIKRR